MVVNRLKTKIFLPITLLQAWDFFSNPLNLKLLTPPWLKLKIVNQADLPKEIYSGLIICYQIHPLPFMKNSWVTEISHVKPGNFFIDEQKIGPYSFWHHQHFFKEIEKGVIMEDIIHYKAPGGRLGSILLSGYLRSQLKKIFDFRIEKMSELYSGTKSLL